MKNSTARERWNKALQLNYGTPAIELVRGKGAVAWDADGLRYLDFLAGIATNIVGHAHPLVVAAVTKQVKTLSHVSNFYSNEPALLLAEKLKSFAGDDTARIFFCNSGAEANEAALKISRLTGRTRIISTEGAFHGRTMGALSMTGQSPKRLPFLPLMKDVNFLPYGDTEAMVKKINRKVAMVIIEPIQGENGVVLPPVGYLAAIRKACTDNGVLLCIDAVQTGMGRTGTWFGYESENITPDIITLAKGLGGGLPLGAMITLGSTTPAFMPGDHGSTFGGNPIAAAAGLAAISVIERGKLLKRVVALEKKIKREVALIPGVKEVRGRGLLLGIVLDDNIAQAVKEHALSIGLLINNATPSVIRIAPPLVITDAQVNEFVKKISASIFACRAGSH